MIANYHRKYPVGSFRVQTNEGTQFLIGFGADVSRRHCQWTEALTCANQNTLIGLAPVGFQLPTVRSIEDGLAQKNFLCF
jgi:hypothetical protein